VSDVVSEVGFRP